MGHEIPVEDKGRPAGSVLFSACALQGTELKSSDVVASSFKAISLAQEQGSQVTHKSQLRRFGNQENFFNLVYCL